MYGWVAHTRSRRPALQPCSRTTMHGMVLGRLVSALLLGTAHAQAHGRRHPPPSPGPPGSGTCVDTCLFASDGGTRGKGSLAGDGAHAH